MANSNYDRGASKERELMKLFKDADMNKDAYAIETIRSAGSHSLFDVTILTPTGVRFIQVKTIKKGNNWKSEYEVEVEKLRELPKVADNITYEYWVYENYEGWIHREIVQ